MNKLDIKPAPQPHYNESLITCPYCGHKDRDSWEFGGDEGSAEEQECGECERTFMVTRHVSITYTSEPIKEGGQ